MITQLGQDGFGDKIISELKTYGVDTAMIERTSEANTSLAFVALQADGNREFSFYRKPGADMLMRPDQLLSLIHIYGTDQIKSPTYPDTYEFQPASPPQTAP